MLQLTFSSDEEYDNIMTQFKLDHKEGTQIVHQDEINIESQTMSMRKKCMFW